VEPLKFENIYVEKVWGGRTLNGFKNDLPDGQIGESWEISCHDHATSIVANGVYKGRSLSDVISIEKKNLIGTAIDGERFPLLMKFLDAKNELSIQVHPNDDYALKNENDLGKTEAWVVLEAGENANMVLGTKNATPEEFRQAVENNNLEPLLNRVSVEKGDVYFIKSGLIHTMEDVLVAEIQQNSDTTYRVYDFGRGRELHIDKALDVMDMSLKGSKSKGLSFENNHFKKTYYCFDSNFSLERYDVFDEICEQSDEERFFIFTCIDGIGTLNYSSGSMSLEKGESLLIPATLGEYSFKGTLSLLKSYVPDTDKLRKEILDMVDKTI
jgi:mannose-6-phosphate isomerase